MAKRLPKTKRELEQKVQSILDKLIVLFHIEDWRIYWHISNDDSDCCAEVMRRGNFKEATITIYSKVIKDMQKDGYDETLEDVLTHEIVHVFLYKCFLNVDEKVTTHPQFLAAEEILVEEIVRLLNER